MYFFAKGETYRGREQLLKASHLAFLEDIHIAQLAETILTQTTYGISVLCSDEDLTAICQLIYLDFAQRLQFNTPLIFSQYPIAELDSPSLHRLLFHWQTIPFVLCPELSHLHFTARRRSFLLLPTSRTTLFNMMHLTFR
ncbi:hypothetical protein BDZ89DRAFT_5699 [Hymenopellis radicata]|nr:hypothetical protein BDZ89DRAFT_5699 [Hymenopellis radicata]